jgi:hypothetical protein
VSAVSFVSVFIVVGAAVVVLYDIFRGAAPGVFSQSGAGGSVEVLRSMVPALYLAVAALAILFAHLRQAPPPFRPGVFSWSRGPAAPTVPPPTTPPPTQPAPSAPTEVLTSDAPPPRKRTPRKRPDTTDQ